ncbi:primosomal replication protein N [Piscinibacter sakaiensis]|uniref:Primosomal replication protein N n=1 Tax=Piscinibacter sakaiensis TaxID=1547922 RepID=A0A0K8NWD9_PISS1|nr:primosomal replication protein N [Piscinibacter sakaiensis]GAP34619.1 primosomal replication protein N [Piscinibacter sakaiensis]
MNPAPEAPSLNRLVLTAELVARGALRYTPAGLPALDLSLRHAGTVQQLGQPRQLQFELKARAVGEALTRRLESLELGRTHAFAGFLGAQRNGRGIVFHVTELD